jgi:hypothetical protein
MRSPASTPRATRPPLSPAKRVLFGLVLLSLSGVIALALGEVILRVAAIPGITYHTFYYDPVTGGKLYPHTTLIYRNARGDEVRRRVNAWGFLDVEHEAAPRPRSIRIGIFGDSYAEARHVPIADTFIRVIERGLNERAADMAGVVNRRHELVTSVETISFGISGRGPLQSYLECREWMEKADLDYVVYVFIENDPGDQVRQVKGSDEVPYPVLAGDSFTVDFSFNDRYGHKASGAHRTWQRLKSNSLVLSTLEGRTKLLLRHGIKREVTPADRAGGAQGAGVAMAPSTWPPELVSQGWELVERVVDRWRSEVEGAGRRFVIYRVPREEELEKPLAEQDTWAPRLHDYCARRGIPLVDPTADLVAELHRGREVYYDHFTIDGHRAFAEAFVRFFLADVRAMGAPAPADSL